MIYLDSAATSLLKPKSVSKAMMNAMSTMASPGRGAYTAAMRAADKVYECRELVCRLFHLDNPENVVFTMNATHALNIAIKSLVKRGNRVVISGYEHNSVTRVLHETGADTVVAEAPLFDSKAVASEYDRLLKNADAAVINHVSNVFGFIQPVDEVAELCRKYKVPLIIDASQSAGILDIDFETLGAEYIAMPGHKGLMGPQGTGILLCKGLPDALIQGGTGSDSAEQGMPLYLPDRAEAGTHNVVGIAGLAEGIRYVLNIGPEKIGAYEARLCRMMADEISSIKGAEVFSSLSGAQAGVLSFRYHGIEPERICAELSKRNIAARCGLHCAPLAHKTAKTFDTGTVRLSFSPFISKQQVYTAGKNIKNILIL